MKRSTTFLFIIAAFPLFLISAEPSAFGAGDLTSSNPYGLTSKEKVILETKKKLKKVAVKSNNQANELDSLRDRLDGLQSVIESLSRKAHNNKVKIQQQEELHALSDKSSNEYEKRLSEIVQTNSENIAKQKILITQISQLVDTMNAKYVSKDALNALVNDVNNFKALVAKELSSKSKKSSNSKLSGMSSAKVLKQADAYFKKRYYTNAIENFEYLIKKHYKPAYSHYMIGEMNYRRKNYANAISYFKKSSSLYSKASYMPNLMLHTAVSMSKTGDKAHAKTFFEAIVAKYPHSAEAKDAKIYLQP